MSFLSGLNAGISTALLCALLFIDEAGVPLPFAPNEVLLLAAGLLIASGGLSPFVFLPAALLATTAGMLAGYTWAGRVGAGGLRRAAAALHAQVAYDRAASRLRTATPTAIGVTRCLPGVRTYATLVAGAAHVDRRTFLRGAVPAMVVWVVVITLLGVLVGVPVERLLGRVEKLAVTGALLVLLGAGGFLALRRIPPAARHAMPMRAAPALERLVVALALDLGVVGCVVVGVDWLLRVAVGASYPEGPNEALVIVAAVLVGYVAATRRGVGGTAGEQVFEVSYRAPSRPLARFPGAAFHRVVRRRRPRAGR